MHKITDLFHRTKNQNGKYKKPYYSLRNVHSGRVADLAQDGPSAGSLILWDGYGGENQQFTFIQDGPDYFIKNRKSHRYLTVENPGNGARIFEAPLNKQPNQRFRIDDAKPGSTDKVIYTFCGKVLDVLEGAKQNGAIISQYDFNGNSNQLWNFCDPKNITSSSSSHEK